MSAIEIPDGSLFGLDNLPYGVFAAGGAAPRAGVRVADSVIDLAAALRDEVFAAPALNPFMAEGPARWAAARARITELVTAGEVPAGAIYPVRRGGAAAAVRGRPTTWTSTPPSTTPPTSAGSSGPNAEPLMPNWKHLPVGYHGRAGTVVVSGTNVIRPSGQRKGPGDQAPVFGPSVRLDIEAEAGLRGRRRLTPRHAGPDERVRRARVRRGPRQRLVRPRPAGLGVRAARTAPRQVVRDLGLAVGGAARRAAGRPRPAARPGPGAAAVPAGERGLGPGHRPGRASGTARSSPGRPTRACTGRPPRCSRT